MTLFFSFVHAPEFTYCSIGKLVNCEFYVFYFSALYTFRYVLIVKVILLILIQKKKTQKKRKKQKMTRTSVWVKIPKLCHKMPCYLSFLLGKGGNTYISNPMKSYQPKCAF